MTKDVSNRKAFASFLSRLAHGAVDNADWQKHIVMHYDDEFLEELRQCVVRLEVTGGLHCQTQTLVEWARAVELSIAASHNDDAQG